MSDNNRLKFIINDAKLVCRHKFNLVQMEQGADNADVQAIQKESKSVFVQFDDPAIWTQPIPFDEVKITEHVLNIDLVDPKEVDQYLLCTRDFLTYLKVDILKAPLAAITDSLPTDWNLRILNGLRVVQFKINGRKKYFKNHGSDLDQSPKFQKLEKEQQELVKRYRELLTANEVEGKETDLLLLGKIGNAIQESTDLKKFIQLFVLLSKFIAGKINQATTPEPGPVDPDPDPDPDPAEPNP